MSGKNILELAAAKDIDGATVFEATFPSQHVNELMLEFDPKRVGPPLVVLTGGSGAKELHPAPLRGREGRYATHLPEGPETFSSVKVSMLRGTKGRLLKVKLIGKPS